jgi:hypothetical protein
LLVSYAAGGSVSEGANHKAFRRMDLRLFKYSSLPGLGQRTTSVWKDKALWAALFELDCCPGFKADTAGECHDPDGRPAAKATLAPEDLDEEV